MKKIKKITILLLILFVILLSSCGKEKETDYTPYIEEIQPIFNSILTLNEAINNINSEDENSYNDLISNCKELSSLYLKLSQIEPPEEFIRTKNLSKEAYDYMIQATDYFSSAFDNNERNDSKIENGMECYKRANKRLHFIIKLLHNEPFSEQ